MQKQRSVYFDRLFPHTATHIGNICLLSFDANASGEARCFPAEETSAARSSVALG